MDRLFRNKYRRVTHLSKAQLKFEVICVTITQWSCVIVSCVILKLDHIVLFEIMIHYPASFISSSVFTNNIKQRNPLWLIKLWQKDPPANHRKEHWSHFLPCPALSPAWLTRASCFIVFPLTIVLFYFVGSIFECHASNCTHGGTFFDYSLTHSRGLFCCSYYPRCEMSCRSKRGSSQLSSVTRVFNSIWWSVIDDDHLVRIYLEIFFFYGSMEEEHLVHILSLCVFLTLLSDRSPWAVRPVACDCGVNWTQ